MIFTKHAENKFDILNKHKIYFTREQIEDVIKTPEKIEKKNKFVLVNKDDIKVIYQEKDGIKKILTFYPIK